MFEWLVLVGSAFLAGILNSIAGGGSFLTFPALVFVGIPPVAANATSAVAVFPGYLGGAIGFFSEIKLIDRRVLSKYFGISLIGGGTGGLLLLFTNDALFSFLVPWLLLFATVLFGAGDAFLRRLNHTHIPISLEMPLLLLVSIYGGYFNGGLGIVLLAVLLLFGFVDLNQMNGLKNAVSLVISIVSVVVFAVAGMVHWPEALIMMVSSSFGGYYGAVIAKRIPPLYLRIFITGVGCCMTAIFFGRL